MQRFSVVGFDEELVQQWARRHVNTVCRRLQGLANQRTAAVAPRLEKVLEAFSSERVATQHFASLTGYGHGDQAREVVDRVFARVLGAEKAAVRLQFVSGTHAIAAALFGVLRPGDQLLSVTGQPYDTLEEVIGLRGSGQGSIAELEGEKKSLVEGKRVIDKFNCMGCHQFSIDTLHLKDGVVRSEERRVGKECRSRWSPYH